MGLFGFCSQNLVTSSFRDGSLPETVDVCVVVAVVGVPPPAGVTVVVVLDDVVAFEPSSVVVVVVLVFVVSPVALVVVVVFVDVLVAGMLDVHGRHVVCPFTVPGQVPALQLRLGAPSVTLAVDPEQKLPVWYQTPQIFCTPSTAHWFVAVMMFDSHDPMQTVPADWFALM